MARERDTENADKKISKAFGLGETGPVQGPPSPSGLRQATNKEVADSITGGRKHQADSIIGGRKQQAAGPQKPTSSVRDKDFIGPIQPFAGLQKATPKQVSDNITTSRKQTADKIQQQREANNLARRAPSATVAGSNKPTSPTIAGANSASPTNPPLGLSHAQGNAQPGHISPLVVGDTQRTMLHTSVANQIINTVNSIWNMRGTGGIRIHRAGHNIVIDGSNIETTGSSDPGEPSTDGGINFRGRWDVTTKYDENDVVTMILDGDYGIQGTYLSLKDSNTGNQPPTGNTGVNEYWTTLAKNQWKKFVVGDIDYPDLPYFPATNNNTYVDGGHEIAMKGTSGYGFREDGITRVTASLSLSPDLGIVGSGQLNTFSYKFDFGYADYPLHIEPVKFTFCQDNKTYEAYILMSSPVEVV